MNPEKMKIGLTLGKFAPLHCGHQSVIEASLKEMDHTIVLIYDCPELDVCPLPIRSQWIRELYPSVEVLEAWDGPSEIGLEPSITAKHDAYLKSRFEGRSVTHFFSSEPYGEHVSMALNAIDRCVDVHRDRIPISGTVIRMSPFESRHFLHARVYRDLVTHVVFVGAPSTGKTTLAELMAKRHNTVWMPEYGREYWEQNQIERRLSETQLLEIAVGHRAKEDRLVTEANRYFFIDTDATTTLQFSYYYHGAAQPELKQLANETRQRYDLFFLCEPDIPYDDTWDRSGEVSRITMHRRVEADLLSRRIPFHRLTGGLDERSRKIDSVLSACRKFG